MHSLSYVVEKYILLRGSLFLVAPWVEIRGGPKPKTSHYSDIYEWGETLNCQFRIVWSTNWVMHLVNPRWEQHVGDTQKAIHANTGCCKEYILLFLCFTFSSILFLYRVSAQPANFSPSIMKATETCSNTKPSSTTNRPTTRPWIALKHFFALLLLITLILLPMYMISFQQTSKYAKTPSQLEIKRPILPNLTGILTFSEIKPMAKYLIHGPESVDIGPSKTFPVPIVKTARKKLLDYISWHAKQMSCIREEVCFNKHRGDFNIMIWKCRKSSKSPCTDIGASFRGIVSSFIIAVLTEKVFLIHWSTHPYPYSFISAVAPGAIDWRVPPHVEMDSQNWGIMRESKYPKLLWIKCPPDHECRTRLNSGKQLNSSSVMTALNMSHEDSYNTMKSFPNITIVSTGSFLNDLLQHPLWLQKISTNKDPAVKENGFHSQRTLLRTLFKPSPITEVVMRYVLRHSAKQNGYLSIHIRGTCTTLSRFKTMVSYCPTMAKDILDCVTSREEKPKFIFVSSPSFALKNAIGEASLRYGIEVMHLDRRSIDNRNMFGNTILRRGYQNSMAWVSFIYSFADFFALAKGTTILSDESPFSEQAGLISKTNKIHVFHPHSQNRSLCRQTWQGSSYTMHPIIQCGFTSSW